MKIQITAKANAKQNKVEKLDETHFRVQVKAPPDEGRANAAILKALSEYFRIPLASIQILAGHKSKNKIIGIAD